MAMAALGNAARRLASQRPPAIHRAAATEMPRRLFHRGSSAVGRSFSLAAEQRRMMPRLMHGGSPAVGRTYSRQSHSFDRSAINFLYKVKEAIRLCHLTMKVVERASIVAVKCVFIAAVVVDLSGPRFIPQLTRVLLRLEPLEERVPRGSKEGKEAETKSS